MLGMCYTKLMENTANMLEKVQRGLPRRDGARKLRPELLPPLTLAYIGDTVFDLFIRTWLVTCTDGTVNALHRMSAERVCAHAQAVALHKIEALLSEDELAIFKRGRNSHMGTVPKHAAITDYRAATGLEALFGYLYLSGSDERLSELMLLALEGNASEETKDSIE